jgi:hypothetical protein
VTRAIDLLLTSTFYGLLGKSVIRGSWVDLNFAPITHHSSPITGFK